MVDRGRQTGFNDRAPGWIKVWTFGQRRSPCLKRALTGCVRGQELTSRTVLDDADIVHVLQSEVIVPDFHTYGGLTLRSRFDEGLVVKLAGVNAGFTATGKPLDVADRIGGSLRIVGTPGFPVVLTSLADDTVGAGNDTIGRPLLDTNNDLGTTVAQSGDWRSVLLNPYANDRNVAMTGAGKRSIAGCWNQRRRGYGPRSRWFGCNAQWRRRKPSTGVQHRRFGCFNSRFGRV